MRFAVYCLIIMLLLWLPGAASAGQPAPDGQALYKKNCSGCHPNPGELLPVENFISFLRQPLPAMPAFGEDRLPDEEAKLIEKYALNATRHGEKLETPAAAGAPAPAAPRPAGPVHTAPVQAAAAPVAPEPAAQREKKARPFSFVKNWTVKGKRNGEVIAFQTFEITENKRNEFQVVPGISLNDYSAKVTAFEIADTGLKLQLNWKWKNSPSYWKIDVYQLTPSPDGKKLTGTYTMRSSGGQNATMQVWAE